METLIVKRATRASRMGALAGIVVLAVVCSMPWWAEVAHQHLVAEIFYTIALAQMWNLLAGYGGVVSVGQQAYLGIGAYSLVLFGLDAGVNPFVVIVTAGVVSALIALPMAGVLFRLKGAHLAVGTWVLAEVFRLLVANTDALGGGSGTSVMATMRGIAPWWRESLTLWIAVALGAGGCLFVYVLLISRYGLALMAVRDNDAGAGSLGVSVRAVRWLVYVCSAAGCGMTGALIFVTKLRVSPEAAFSVDWSALMLFVVVIGGIGSIEGPIIGTLLYFVLRQSLSDWGVWYQIVLGAVAIGFMILRPRGIWGAVSARLGLSVFPTERRLFGLGSDTHSAHNTFDMHDMHDMRDVKDAGAPLRYDALDAAKARDC
ncbi:branched-chain amino acid ABC transporter permease [Pararobbsia silviterrae]|uniref:Branched-chain amino acid ABC transporter permease n=1 Tax=Pararobbsia silviterrae TaxID=1792498 RepID=A0A494XBV9_9BURK|nr:branched-chain amino acid ABC transporter permease [Pararobbsia silviterrae]RKP47121.1 branched-chain amino acid ABC transporter permease [Pararobbsia silviterrae]